MERWGKVIFTRASGVCCAIYSISSAISVVVMMYDLTLSSRLYHQITHTERMHVIY